MSNETITTTEPVAINENNITNTNSNNNTSNNQIESSNIYGQYNSNGSNQAEPEEYDPTKTCYDNDNTQQINSKNDLEPEHLRKVFIGGLSYKTDDQTFRDYFSRYGDIIDCIIMRDREGRSRGFGFVTYSSLKMVDCLMAGRPHILDTREIEPKRAVPRDQSGKPESSITAKKLFVGGIREGVIDEHDLNEYFSKYGNIIDAVIMKTNDGKFRGFGFVEFDDYDPVDKIVLEKHHAIKGNSLNVEKALPKDQTKSARTSVTNQRGSNSGGRGMRGSSSKTNSGWGPMGGQSFSNNNGNYRHDTGGYAPGPDYDNQPPAYGNNYGGNMDRGGDSSMMGFSNSGPMSGNGNGGGYGMGGPPRNDYADFGAFGPPPDYNFGQNYGSSSGGGPMRRGGGVGGRSGGPYNRGGGRGGYRGRN